MRICIHFNTPKGCVPPSGECKFEHVLYCTNPLCEGASAKTHTHATCGRKGGGGHDAFIAAKRKEAMAAKKAKKPKEAEAVTEGPTKIDILEELYKLVLTSFVANKSDGYSAVTDLYPFALAFTPEKLAGKIVGMLHEGLEQDEIVELTVDGPQRETRILEALDVLQMHKDAPEST